LKLQFASSRPGSPFVAKPTSDAVTQKIEHLDLNGTNGTNGTNGSSLVSMLEEKAKAM
jgi:hypothetical protein